MRSLRPSSALSALASILLVASLSSWATADDPPGTLAGRWRERRGLAVHRSDVRLAPGEAPGTWMGETYAPRDKEPRRITLRRSGAGWELVVERRVRETVGASGVLEGRTADGWTWGSAQVVALEVEDGRLKGKGFDLPVPPCPSTSAAAPVTTTTPTTTAPGPGRPPVDGSLGSATPPKPVVRVLITGFDRFPTLRNHPSKVHDGVIIASEPSTNPAGWSVRNFDPVSLDPALRQQADIQVHRMLDLCVHYVEAGQRVADEIRRVDADVCISFGVGSDNNADADVETTCFNRMSDGGVPFGRGGEGPFQLPTYWPPQGAWSDEDRSWSWRYPDNAGVSMAGKAIDPEQDARLTSSLPVAAIVRRIQRERLEAHDGRGGPGEYVCNSVMFKVVQTQAARGRIGGFVHLAQWEEEKRESYLKVVRCAIEESVKAVLATRASR